MLEVYGIFWIMHFDGIHHDEYDCTSQTVYYILMGYTICIICFDIHIWLYMILSLIIQNKIEILQRIERPSIYNVFYRFWYLHHHRWHDRNSSSERDVSNLCSTRNHPPTIVSRQLGMHLLATPYRYIFIYSQLCLDSGCRVLTGSSTVTRDELSKIESRSPARFVLWS